MNFLTYFRYSWMKSVILNFLSQILYSLRIQFVFNSFSILNQEIFWFFIRISHYIFRNFIDLRLKAKSFQLLFILLRLCSFNLPVHFLLFLHSSCIQKFAIILIIMLPSLSQNFRSDFAIIHVDLSTMDLFNLGRTLNWLRTTRSPILLSPLLIFNTHTISFHWIRSTLGSVFKWLESSVCPLSFLFV